MKKFDFIAVTLLCLAILSACGSDSKEPDPPLKTEAEVQSDLEQSEYFWYLLAPNAVDEYSITDFAINGHIVKEEESDLIAVAVTAESKYAVYAGTFSVTYLYQEGEYIFDSIYQGLPGSYSDIKLPPDDFAKSYFELEMASVNGKLLTAEIEGVPSDNKICKMNAVYESRDDAEHCTSTVSAYAVSRFEGGTWQYENTIMGINVTDEINVYDKVNEIYWRKYPVSGGIELVNAYIVDEHQYYDCFAYYSYAEINYEDIIKYGFIKKEYQVLEESRYMGCEGHGLLGEFLGPIDEETAIQYLEQVKSENSDILIILDPNQYLEETLPIPGSVIISKQYADEDGLQIAEVAHKGTIAYEEALSQ